MNLVVSAGVFLIWEALLVLEGSGAVVSRGVSEWIGGGSGKELTIFLGEGRSYVPQIPCEIPY